MVGFIRSYRVLMISNMISFSASLPNWTPTSSMISRSGLVK
jgi:hypothetical protein